MELLFPLIILLIIIIYIAWLIGIIKETHEKSLVIETKLDNIEKMLEKFNYKEQ